MYLAFFIHAAEKGCHFQVLLFLFAFAARFVPLPGVPRTAARGSAHRLPWNSACQGISGGTAERVILTQGRTPQPWLENLS